MDGDIAEDTAGHYYVNMPKTGTNTLMLSDATVGTIKVYDDGGKSAPFSSSCEGTLVITAPVGYVINIEGEVTTKSSSYDFLYIFDSNEADFSKQLGSMAGDTDQGYANIDCISSTGNYMTLYFESSTEDNDAAGLDFTVTLTQKKNFTLCTATLPDQSLDGYSNMYYKFDAANYGYVTIGETVKDGETVLTLGTDYTFGSVTFADMTGHDENDAPSAVGDVWRVPIIGMGDYAGTKYVDFTIVNPNGTWGDLTWSLADDGTLSITGTGAMKTADTYGKYPWNNYCSSVTAITIGEGITSIAPYAFGGQNYIDIYSNVKTVTLPSTLTSIGDEAFRGCTGSDFKSVVIPAGVTSIGGNAFYGCTGVANVYCYADPTKLTWEDTGDDFIVDNTNPKQTKCHVADASAWSGFSGVNVTFVGDLATTSIPYIDANGNTQYCTDFTVLTNSTDVSNLPGGWYVVKGDVNYTSTVTFTGSATLILANGCTMNVGTSESPINAHGISVTGNGNDLIIYGQSLDEATAGHLNVYVNSEHDDGINVDDAYVQHSGIVNIVSYDCGIVAEGKFDTMSHPIDGTGTVTINGGKITATSSKNYGIYAGSLVTISGGNVSASGDQHGIYTYGNIILGWTNPTDRIYASIYCAHGNVSIANGKAMTDGTKAYTSATPSATLEELENKTLQPITGVSVTKDGSGNLTATLDPSSEEEINIPVAIEVDHVTVNRTYENGKASTVYLPFTIAYDKVTGGTFNTFTSVDEGATPWTVTYTEVTSGNIEANTPYIFLPDGTNSGKIVVDNGTDQVSVCTGNPQTTKQGLWEFIGTYKRIKWTHDTTDQEYNAEREAEIGQVYGFAANDSGTDHVGDFVKVGNDVWINPGRAYLKRTPAAGARALTPDDETQQLPEVMKVVIVSADGTTTEIGTLNTRTGEITTDEWYSLDGQRLNGKPTKKGIYIHNGIKVVIK